MTRPSPLSPWLAALPLLAAALGCGGGKAAPSVVPAAVTPPSLRLEVQTPGLVQVTYADLLAAGFAQGTLVPGALALTNLGLPVALQVNAAHPAQLGPGDTLAFYGQGVDTPFTGTNVYWLTASGGAPRPMATRDGTLASGTPLKVFQDTLHVEQNAFMWSLAPGAPASDYWFWAKLTAPVTQGFSFQLAALDEGAGPSFLTLDLLALTSGDVTPDHHVTLNLNGTPVGDLRWKGAVALTTKVQLPQGALVAGLNTLILGLPGDTGAAVDAVDLNYFEIQSWRPLAASGERLAFTLPAAPGPVQVAGFPDAGTLLLEVTDPLEAAFVTAVPGQDDQGTWHLTFQDPATGPRTYLAQAPAQIQGPSLIEAWTPGALRASTNGADYVLITRRAWLDAVQPLLQLRQSQGLRAKAVAVEDIFNEFAYGMPDPAALQAFLAFAAQAWVQPAPSYVLLLGDATFDYRDYHQTHKLSQVPCHMGPAEGLGIAPDDNWYAALDGVDEVPSLNLGRLPAASAEQAAAMARKLVAYETATALPPGAALFVADDVTPDFQALCTSLAATLPATVTAQQINLASYTDLTLCTRDILASMNQGLFLATYNGHGDVADWAKNVFNAGDLPGLTNPASPELCLMLNCENCYFGMVGYYCLAESMLADPACGTVGVLGCSSFGYQTDHDLLGQAFFQLLFDPAYARLGDLCTQAKLLAYHKGASVDLLRHFPLIGDPATRFRRPQ